MRGCHRGVDIVARSARNSFLRGSCALAERQQQQSQQRHGQGESGLESAAPKLAPEWMLRLRQLVANARQKRGADGGVLRQSSTGMLPGDDSRPWGSTLLFPGAGEEAGAADRNRPKQHSLRLVSCSLVTDSGSVVTGVNSMLHRALAPAPMVFHKKMLHGCAEHNAVAALAAQGLDIRTIRNVALYAEDYPRDRHAAFDPIPCITCAKLIRAVAEERSIETLDADATLAVHLIRPSEQLPAGYVIATRPQPRAVGRLLHDSISVHSWLMGV
ncbi:hypothetical protein DIPPA_33495 [Diplonema papillatum]|nr:hypothetical protein DIPPA_33495 [Diplonema papillatum]